jgi:subtilase family serine protease
MWKRAHVLDRIVGLCVLLTLPCLPLVAHAQVTDGYILSDSEEPYEALTGGTELFTDSDDGFQKITLPFTFKLHDKSYDSVWVSVNGGVAFVAQDPITQQLFPLPSVNVDLPSTTQPQALIAAFWDDWAAIPAAQGGGSSVRWDVVGDAPSREIVIDWQRVQRFGFTGADKSSYSFQLRLRETTNAYEVRFGEYLGIEDSPLSGTSGSENHLGTLAFPHLDCNPNCTATDMLPSASKVITPNRNPELSLTLKQVGAENGGPKVEVSLRNSGNVEATNVLYRVYLSADQTLDAGDTVAVTDTVPSLAPTNGSFVNTTAVTLDPALRGSYYLIGVVDPDATIVELNETDNLFVLTPPFIAGPELSTTVRGQRNAIAGEDMALSVIVSNDGVMNANGIRLGVAFSGAPLGLEKKIVHVTDPLNVPALSTVEVAITVKVPSSFLAGRYSVDVIADSENVVTEADETNNGSAVLLEVEVRGPDVSVDNVSLGTERAPKGGNFPIRVTLSNQGLARTGNFFYSVYLSTNEVITLSDTRIFVSEAVSLGGNEVTTQTRLATIPASLATGTYFVGIIADAESRVLEFDRTNNIYLAPTKMIVTEPVGDPAVVSAAVQSTAVAGESARVSGLFANSGALPATFSYGIYISSNATVSEGDLRVGEGQMSLGPASQQTAAFDVPVPATLSAGPYTVGIVIDALSVPNDPDVSNNRAVAPAPLTVVAPSLAITTSELTSGSVGIPYSLNLAAKGGSGQYSWKLIGGALPTGLTLGVDGRITGTPTNPVLEACVVEVQSAGSTALRAYTLKVDASAPSLGILEEQLLPGRRGVAYRQAITAVGGTPPYRITTTSPLPAGLVLNVEGVVSGIPTAEGSYTLPITVKDSVDHQLTAAISLKIYAEGALALAGQRLREGEASRPYAATLPITGGLPPYAVKLSSGAMPQGLGLAIDGSGVAVGITGTPAAAGVYEFAIEVVDSRGERDFAHLVLRVASKRLSFITTTLPVAQRGVRYSAPIETTAPSSAVFSVVSGALPPGLSLNGTLIGGVVASDAPARVAAFAIRVQDGTGGEAIAPFAIEVATPAVSSSSTSSSGCSSTSDLGLAAFMLASAMLLFTRRRARVAGTVATVLVTSSVASAHNLYLVSREIAPYTALDASAGTIIQDDKTTAIAVAVQLPFPFRFFGQEHASVGISKYGILTFSETNTDSGNDALPDPASPNAFIAPFWDYLKLSTLTPDGTANIRWAVEGAEPNRVFVVEWRNIQKNSTTESGTAFAAFSWQIRLSENTNEISVHYGGRAATLGLTPAMTATMGIEGPGPSAIHLSDSKCSPNCLASDFPINTRFRLRLAPNLSTSGITAPAAVIGGDSVTARVSVSNNGGADAVGVKVRYYLSNDTLADVDTDTLVGESAPMTVAAGATTVSTTRVQIPANAAGLKYLLAVVDSAAEIDETNEDDNSSPALAMGVAAPAPDFQATRLLAPTAVDTGTAFDVSRTVRNSGSASGSGSYRIVLSDNEVLSSSDLQLASAPFQLAPGQSIDTADKVTVPASVPPGRYWLGIIVRPDADVTELDALNNSRAFGPITVRGAALAVATSTLPSVSSGVPFALQLTAAGGRGDYAWSVGYPTPPAGVTLSASGELKGLVNSAGEWPFQVKVLSGGTIASANLILRATGSGVALEVVSNRLPSGSVAAPYQGFLIARGGTPPYTWSLASGSVLPDGLFLGGQGMIEGITLSDGDHSIQVAVTDAAGAKASREIVLPVAGSLHPLFATSSLPEGVLGTPYTATLAASGGVRPYRFTIIDTRRLPLSLSDQAATYVGQPPPGLTFAEDGSLSGTPTAAGVYVMYVRVVDSDSRDDTATFVLTISSSTPLSILTASLPDAVVGQRYSVMLAASSESSVTWEFIFAGDLTLPTGLSTSMFGDIQGVPSTVGVTQFLAVARDESGRTAMRALALRVVPAAAEKTTGGGCSQLGSSGVLALVALAAFLVRRRRSAAIAAGALAMVLMSGCTKDEKKSSNCATPCASPFVCDETDGLCKCGGAGGAVCGAGETCDTASKTCQAPTCATSCPAGTTCGDDGACHCGSATGTVCATGTECTSLGRCEVRNVCAGVQCSAGMTCDPLAEGACRCGPGGPACEANQRCVDAECVTDKCFGVACTGETTCDLADGVCKCGGSGGEVCSGGEACDAASKSCVRSSLCDNVTCGSGAVCDPADGRCRCGALTGPVCGDDQTCDAVNKRCMGGDLCQNVTCINGSSCDPEDGLCKCGGFAGIQCATGDLCISSGNQHVCRKPCDAMSPNACVSGLGCDWDDDESLSYCAPAGTARSGETCGEALCSPGLYCQPTESDGRGVCRPYCASDATCATGQMCSFFRAEGTLGICIPLQ